MVFNKAIATIDANMDAQDLGITSLAAALHVSERTMSRVFAREGTMPTQALWSRRLDKSFRLLRDGSASQVTQAAFQCSFNDLSHFSRMFKKPIAGDD